MQPINFLNFSSEQPKDGQDMWWLPKGSNLPCPARFHTKTEHYRANLSLFEGEMTYTLDGSWAPMEYPIVK